MRCDFCFKRCDLSPEHPYGNCRARVFRDGRIEDVCYGNVVALGIDPIEKKPLYHFLPGSQSLSFALPGCNLHCSFCQNWEISQSVDSGKVQVMQSDEIIALAKREKATSISFTYSEPLVWQDYLIDVATKAKAAGLYCVMVSNGEFSPEALMRIMPLIDAFNIDLKGDDGYYHDVCDGAYKPVIDGITALVQGGKHVEVTTLVIPRYHSKEMIGGMGRDLLDAGVQVWHLSRFFPRYRLRSALPTSEAFLSQMMETARMTGVPYVYAGNSDQDDRTLCPHCHAVLISSHSYGGEAGAEAHSHIHGGRCALCGTPIYGVWQ